MKRNKKEKGASPDAYERKIRRTENTVAVIELGLLAVFLLLCPFWKGPVIFLIMTYGGGALLSGGMGYRRIRKLSNLVMQRVDDTILQLIDGEKAVYFSGTEDDLLGKFQSQIGKLYDVLTAHEEREKKLRKELSSLVADLVHQINTPLTNIDLYCGFLADESLDDDTRKLFLDRIQGQVEKMKWFGSGFDKAARLETDIICLRPKEQPLFPILLGAIDQIFLKAEERGLEIALEGDEEVTAWFDEKWTEEAIFNLLDNGVKYATRKGTIKVRVIVYDLFVRVDVEDVSQTIGEEEYNQIFQRFYRGKSSAMVSEGVGLGLYLTRRIIRGQGGYLKIGKGPEGGNVFSVFLNVHKYAKPS